MTDSGFASRLLSPECHLRSQLQREQPSHEIRIGIHDHDEQASFAELSVSPPRLRPKSSHEVRSVLSPSPLFSEPSRRSKDDSHLAPSPVTPKRPNISSRGLSLQMPPRDISSTSTANLTKRVPLSPKLDASAPYASPSSVLPRRSRGLDFSRACTNLHHSTLAEQSSPDSSPTIGSRGMMIPSRRSLLNPLNIANLPDSPGNGANSIWPQAANTDKSVISSSLGSTNMMEYDFGSASSSDDDHVMGHAEDEDTIHMTPQMYKAGNGTMNSFGPAIISSPGGDGIGGFSPAASKMMSFQRARLQKGRSRKKSSSASTHSSMYSPGSRSPPLSKSIEGSWGGSVFSRDFSKGTVDSRRESLSLGTDDLHIFDGEESDEGMNTRGSPSDSLNIVTPTGNHPCDERRNVIRRAVTRRGNLLPKSKGFARIQAALHEEDTPVDTEVRREAEVIRQVRESDVEGDLMPQPSQTTTTASSPCLVATTSNQSDLSEYNSEDLMITGENSVSRRSSSSTFTSPAIRIYNGLGFWNTFDERMRTPPPVNTPRRNSSSVSDEISMDAPISSIQQPAPQQNPLKAYPSIGSRSSTPQPLIASIDTTRKGNKRMRDDDFDPNYFKRRAVSPGMSLQNSPILPQSPLQRDGGWWGPQPKTARETPGVQIIGERVSSGGSASSGSGSVGPQKRVGFQGMSDTNDGLMNMSIE